MHYNPFPNKPWFLRVCSTSLLKTLWEKEKLLVTSNFSFSHSVFYPFGELSVIFIKFKIVVCKLFSIWKGLKFVVWERVKVSSAICFNLVQSKMLLIGNGLNEMCRACAVAVKNSLHTFIILQEN